MDELLTPVSTTYLRSKRETKSLLSEENSSDKIQDEKAIPNVSSADAALEVLKNQPGYDGLTATLRYLTKDDSPSSFQLQVPSPKSAAIIQVLVTEIVPNYWTLLQEGSADDGEPADLDLLLQCLRTVTGLNAVMAHIKAVIREATISGQRTKQIGLDVNLEIFLHLLTALLDGEDSLRTIWVASTSGLSGATQTKVQSQNLVSFITTGKVVSLAAEALDIASKKIPSGTLWIADGIEFSGWVGRNIVSWSSMQPNEEEVSFISKVFHRSMSLGYPECLVNTVTDLLLLSNKPSPNIFAKICLSQHQVSKKVMEILIKYLAQRFLNNLTLDGSAQNTIISAVAGLLDAVVGRDESNRAHFINWCTAASGAGLGDSIGIRRAVVAVLAKDRETITMVLERSLAQFGDQLYVKHAAILQQEAHTQVLLLCAGYVARQSPIKLAMLLRSGTYLTAISNRIAATQARARFLGMAVGESLSALVDSKKRLDFHMDEMGTDEAEWLKGVSSISDPVGSFHSLLSSSQPDPQASFPAETTGKRAKVDRRPIPKPAVKQTIPKAIIEEIESSDDDDLVPYPKGSDPEDSDDDATLVQRNKPKAPVYIRDLITYLRDSENYEKQKLALRTAPILIRRKANYGTEVSSHADEVAGLLVGLQDKYELEDFLELRQQGMIALVASQPKAMAPWFARTFFEGDYSLAQRTSVLITLGLSAREIAGYDTSSYQDTIAFPSKKLPEKMERLFIDSATRPRRPSQSFLKSLPPNSLGEIARSLTSSFLGPLAVEAADATTGPDVLKLQTFTARYKAKSQTRPQIRAIPNTTAALLAASFFSPLTAHFQLALRSSKSVVLNPALLSLYLQTLGIVVNAAGPSTLSLPQLTSELWDLLLRTRVHVLGDIGAMKGWFVAMAVLLEVNQDDMRRVCQEHGREMVETREWVSGVFERTRGDDGGEENEVKMLSAGVLIKIGEAIEAFQSLLLGEMIGVS
ncbi:hypothetical protein DCS_03864 [Drechmeria coniospora]|uniref:Telomere length regulation protein conserved domain-containing protein n=1 Tax=Drechmeria coniospora TaxID=98403 RepID=A0A151GIE6_DRECN|nr:hypothetical protein DCS_03864 [Drechmeria coniospora]KYK56858.1 hypothetical protein DCS_03864 [Drechmeria coniospora]ODA78319.1 hypothetical protein RJ55_05700 [Drechmeria coniospora]